MDGQKNIDRSLKDSEESEEGVKAEGETYQIRKVALYAFGLNLFLAALKGLLALSSGSLAVTTGAIDSISDAVASLAVYGGLRLSVQKTRTFPLGLYKIENLISVVVALFIFFAGYEIAIRVFNPQTNPPNISQSLIILLLVATLLVFLFSRYSIAVGEKTESPTLMAEGRHRQTDVLSTLVIWISVVVHYFEAGFDIWGITVDQIAAALVLIFIVHTGWGLLVSGMRVLLDASLDHETIDQVKKIIKNHAAVVEVGSVVGRNAGRFRFLQAEVRLRTNDLHKAHQISEQIEQRIHDQIPHVERVTIHYEPSPRQSLRVAVPLTDPKGKIGSHFGEAPYFALVQIRLDSQAIEDQKILENPFTQLERGKGIKVAEWLINENIDSLLVKEDLKNKGPRYALSDAGVKWQVISAETLEEAIQEFLQERE